MSDKIDELIIDFVTSHNGKQDYYAGRNIAAEMQAIALGEEKVASKSQKAKAKTAALGNAMGKTATQAQLLSRAFRLVAGFLAVGKLKEYADQWINIKSILSLVTNSELERANLQDKLYKLSQKTRQNMLSTVDLYRRISVSTEELGLSEEKRLSLVEAINKALIVGGGTTAGNNGALIQLGQGLASGQLRGQELNSILEQAPRLAQMIAEGMGTQTGKLREIAKEGKLTPDVVLNAILKQVPEINSEFDKMETSVSQVLVKLGNSFGRFVSRLNEATGATSFLSKAIGLLTSAFDLLAENVQIVSVLIGGLLIKRLMTLRRIFLESRAPIGSLRNSLQMLVSGEIKGGLVSIINSLKTMIGSQFINGMKAFAVAGWAMVAPFLKLAAIIWLVRLFLKLCKELFNLFTGKENIFEDFWLMVFENMPDIKAWFKNILNTVQDFAKEFAEIVEYPFNKLWEFIQSIGEKIGEWIAEIVILIQEGVSKAWENAKGTVKGWFGFEGEKQNKAVPSEPRAMPKIPQAPVPSAVSSQNQSYNDNKVINVTINEAKDGQASYNRFTSIINNNQTQTPFRLAASGLGYAK